MMAKAYAVLVFLLIFLLAPTAQAGFSLRKNKRVASSYNSGNNYGHDVYELPNLNVKQTLLQKVKNLFSLKPAYDYPYRKKSKIGKAAVTLEGLGIAIGYAGLIAGHVSGNVATYLVGATLGTLVFIAGMVCGIVAMAKKEKKILQGIILILFGLVFLIPLFLGF